MWSGLAIVALVLVPGLGATLAFALPGAVSIESRLALLFGLGYAIVAGTATLLALGHVFSRGVFLVAIVVVTAAVWRIALRRASMAAHLAAFRAQAREAPFAVAGGLALLVTVAATRAFYPPESSLAIRASWRYWSDGLEVAAAGQVPAQTHQWGIEFPTTVSKVGLNSFEGAVSMLFGPDPLPSMRVILGITAVGLVAALLALGRELGLSIFAPLVPALVVLVPARLPLSHELARNLFNYTAEDMGRMAAFSAAVAGIYAMKKQDRAAAVIAGITLAISGITHLIPTLIAGAILLFSSIGFTVLDRSLLRTVLVIGALIATAFAVPYVVVIASSGGDLGFQRAAGESESSLPPEVDPTLSLARGSIVPKLSRDGHFLISPIELIRDYGEQTIDRPVRARQTLIGLLALALASIVMVIIRRSLLTLVVVAWGLCATMLLVAAFFSYRFDTVVPGTWGVRRLYAYAALVPGLLVPGLLEGLVRMTAWRSRLALAVLSVSASLVAIGAAVDRVPRHLQLEHAQAGLAVIDRVKQTVPCGVRMLSNARTAGTWEATTGRRAVTEGHAVFLRPQILERVLPVMVGANEFFRDPLANRDYLTEQGIEYLVVVKPKVWVGTAGDRMPGAHDADAIAALPGVNLVVRDQWVSIFAVGSPKPVTGTSEAGRCPL